MRPLCGGAASWCLGPRENSAVKRPPVTGEETAPYDCDALTGLSSIPLVVVIPDPGAGSGRSCGLPCAECSRRCAGCGDRLVGRRAAARDGRVFLSQSSMPSSRSIRSPALRRAMRRAHLAISEVAAPYGLYYAPESVEPDCLHDRRQRRRNSGGVHCLNTPDLAQRPSGARFRRRARRSNSDPRRRPAGSISFRWWWQSEGCWRSSWGDVDCCRPRCRHAASCRFATVESAARPFRSDCRRLIPRRLS